MFEVSFPTHNPVLIIALVMLVVLLAPLLFARLRIPGLVGLIVAGILIGPHAFGLLERDLTIRVLGTIGLLYIMFLAGLEINLNEFSRHRNRSLLFGALTFALPQGLGTFMAAALLGFSGPQAVLLGSVFASHTLIAYPIVSRLGLARREVVTTAVGATIFTDTAALLVLAVIARSAEGEGSLGFWVLFVALLALYTLAVLRGLPRLGRWFFRTVRAGDGTDFIFVLTAVFTCAFLAELAGVEAIIGAFLAGLALNRLVPEQSPLMNRIRFVGESLFIPFFLLSVGMLVDLGVLVRGPQTWIVSGLMLITILVSKGTAAWAARLLFGYTPAQGWLLFGLTVPQAAATLAAVLIGFDIGLFDEDVLNGTIVMIMVTCMLGPWVVEKHGRRAALQEEQEPYPTGEALQRILIPLSNPATSGALVDLALAIRRAGSEEPIFPLAVVRDDDNVAEQVAAGERLLSHAVMHAVAAGVPVIPTTRVDMDVARGIARATAESRISHVIIGWGGPPSPLQRIFGSILDRLLDLNRASILVYRSDRPINTVHRMLLAVPPLAEREPGFEEALRTVKMLAHRIGAPLTVLAVQDQLRALQQRVRAARPEVPVTSTALESFGRLLPVLSEHATAADLVVLLSARESQSSWQPTLNRLPRLFAQRFPTTDFIVLYPSEHTPESRGAALRSELPPVQVVPGLEAPSAAAALHQLLERRLGDRPEALRALITLLLHERDVSMQEVAPGVVLLHAHSSLVSERMLFAGTSRSGIPFPHLSQAAHLFFVLLNPAELSPEQHLRTLAYLARTVLEAQDLDHPLRIIDPDTLLQMLKEENSGASGNPRYRSHGERF